MKSLSNQAIATWMLCIAAVFVSSGMSVAQTPPPKPASPIVTLPTQATAGGVFTPAKVTADDFSVAKYIRFPKDPALAQKESAVQFYCDIDERGNVLTTYGLIGKDESFKNAVQTGLDWGRFQAATVNGRGVPVYLAGTVLFLRQNNVPITVVTLATHERERVAKITQYSQPQLIGGLRYYLDRALQRSDADNPFGASAEVVVKVGAKGEVISMTITGESPKGSKAGDFVLQALKPAQFTPAYANGKPEAGTLNIIANFSEM